MLEGFPNTQSTLPTQSQMESFKEGEINLLDMYGDTQVTFKGVTGNIRDLISLCPKDLKDMEPDQINSWTADILTQSGHELPDEILARVEPIDAKKKF